MMTALSRALKINVKVAYLDGRSSDGKVDFVEFNHADPGVEPMTLLYRCVDCATVRSKVLIIQFDRPGHYDILDRRETDAV
jgi:ubiquitin thioesterase protein OTUB1